MLNSGARAPRLNGSLHSNLSGSNTTVGLTKMLNMTIAPDFKAFVASLNAHEVHYLIVGGYAVAFHGHPRYTKDLDIWIERTSDNAQRLLKALDAFGFGALGLQEADFLEPDQIIQLGNPPLRIDILTSLSGVTFASCYPEREMLITEDMKLVFIGLEGLRRNKRASGRHQDLADLENLK